MSEAKLVAMERTLARLQTLNIHMTHYDGCEDEHPICLAAQAVKMARHNAEGWGTEYVAHAESFRKLTLVRSRLTKLLAELEKPQKFKADRARVVKAKVKALSGRKRRGQY